MLPTDPATQTKANAMSQQKSQKSHNLRAQNYGSASTIGPRQVSILSDIYDMTSSGERATLDALRFFHPAYAINGNSFLSLRARKLVKGNRNNLQLTPAGLEIARCVQHTVIPMGLGLVAVNVAEKR